MKLATFLLCVFLGTVARAEDISPTSNGFNAVTSVASGPRGVADIKKRQAAKPYYIEFRSRSALSYGHSFAVHGRVGDVVDARHVVGLHPATDSPIPWMIGHLFVVPSETGASDGDTEDKYVTARFRIRLSKAEYADLVTYMAQLQSNSPVWHAVLYNCNAFIADIAKFLKLQTPSSTLLVPKEYITSLRALNEARLGGLRRH